MSPAEELLAFADGRRFGTVYADPPWPSRSQQSATKVDWINKRMRPHYGTLSADQLRSLPVSELALPDAALILWTTWMHLALALECVTAWGFRYATGMPWLKVAKGGQPIFGPGVWFQHCTELLLVTRRGQPRFGGFGNPRPARKGIIIAPRGEHSQKPEEAAQWIERVGFPEPQVELFARQSRPGWAAWGDEL